MRMVAAVAEAMVVEVVVVGSIGARTLRGVVTASEKTKAAVAIAAVTARVAQTNPLPPLVGVSAGLDSEILVRRKSVVCAE